MEDYKIKKYKDMLIEEKDKIENILENSFGNYLEGELSNIDNHPADVGTELFMKEQDEGFKVSHKNTLEEIESALSNIQDGSYGLCDSCGDEINEERLDVLPYASMCTECMEDGDTDTENVYESLDKDYGTDRSHSRDNVQFDREDSYQELAEYEKIPKDPSYSTGDYMGVMDDEEEKNTEDVDNISQEYFDETQ